MASFIRDTESISMGAALSVVLIGPHDERRQSIARAFTGQQSRIVKEFTSYPAFDDLTEIFEGNHDVVLVDLDTDSEKALEIVEHLCSADGSLTVIVYSSRTDSELLVRCMRAGAREFLTEPVLPSAVTEALVRASMRRDEVRRVRRQIGKLFVFAGAKGGAGVTTVATNFALSLAKDSGSKVALLDFDFQLGDAALILGVRSGYSVADAIEGTNRLDSDFLTAMMAKHDSGLSVLCASDTLSDITPTRAAVDKLLRVARDDYGYVVVDAGMLPADVLTALFEAATGVYLVTQVTVADLRNANRILNRHFSGADAEKVQIVLNRYVARASEIDEDAIAKALTRPVKWKLPNDYATVRRAQNTAVPLVLEESPLSMTIRDMARMAAGQAPVERKKKRFGLFG